MNDVLQKRKMQYNLTFGKIEIYSYFLVEHLDEFFMDV